MAKGKKNREYPMVACWGWGLSESQAKQTEMCHQRKYFLNPCVDFFCVNFVERAKKDASTTSREHWNSWNFIHNKCDAKNETCAIIRHAREDEEEFFVSFWDLKTLIPATANWKRCCDSALRAKICCLLSKGRQSRNYLRLDALRCKRRFIALAQHSNGMRRTMKERKTSRHSLRKCFSRFSSSLFDMKIAFNELKEAFSCLSQMISLFSSQVFFSVVYFYLFVRCFHEVGLGRTGEFMRKKLETTAKGVWFPFQRFPET